jgi:hypothetical protein
VIVLCLSVVFPVFFTRLRPTNLESRDLNGEWIVWNEGGVQYRPFQFRYGTGPDWLGLAGVMAMTS